MNSILKIGVVFCLLVLVACDNDDSRVASNGSPKPGNLDTCSGGTTVTVKYDQTVTDAQRELIEYDLCTLKSLVIQEPTAYVNYHRRVIGVDQISTGSLNEWLAERMHYVVGVDYDTDNYEVLDYNFYYSPSFVAKQAKVSGPRILQFEKTPALQKNDFFALNLGAYWYRYKGKNQNQLLQANVAGETITINSPRVGIFQIGDALFSDLVAASAGLQALGNVLWRLSTYFHEARHDDGIYANATYPHGECNRKSGSNCDDDLNGPYGIELTLLEVFERSACVSCSEAEKTGLSLARSSLANHVNWGSSFSYDIAERVE